MLLFFFFFGGCGAWGSALHWLLNGSVAHDMAMYSISIDWGVSFLVKIFSVFPHFSRQKTFWSLPFPFVFLFSCYFFTFSLRLASLTSLVAHFALNLLNFLLIFRYALYLCFFSFLNLCLLSSFSLFFFFFFSFCVSLSLSNVVSFNGGLLWS